MHPVPGVVLDGDSHKPSDFALRPTGIEQKLTDCSFPANSVIEMHTFLVTLIRQFDFSLPEDGREIKKMRRGVVFPAVVGEEHKGPQLPLKVTSLRNE